MNDGGGSDRARRGGDSASERSRPEAARPDQEAPARLRAGDDVYFAELVRCYSPLLLPHLRRYAADSAEVQDLLQEVWLRAWRKRDGYSGRGSFPGWLLTVCRTVGVATVRKRGRARVPEVDDVAYQPDPAEQDLPARLRDAVLALPERQREVVLLRVLEDLSTAETARRLGCAEGTVKATLHQALRRLKDIYHRMPR